MKRDSKLSSALHVLLHMAQSECPVTSEGLADMLRTHPVVVRRTLAGLREHGWVTSAKGHGGGWMLAHRLEDVTLGDVFRALGEPSMVAVGHRSDDPACRVEKAVNQALDDVVREAEAMLRARLDAVTLADLAATFSGQARAIHTGECDEQ